MDMKNTESYNRFEELLKSKSFLELTTEERLLVSEFVTESEFESMAALLSDINEPNTLTSLPGGGAEEVWQKFSGAENSKVIPFRKRKVSVLWPIAMAASVVLLLFIKFSAKNIVFNSASDRNVSVYTCAIPVIQEIVKEIPVYIQSTPNSDIVYKESEYGGYNDHSVYVPAPEMIQIDKSQRQGTNTSEMGELNNLFVSVN
ncbi:MAG: hypothetical protein C0592_10045 [Marinilabiliales bacterium]|nr:MAG: hypothetical protein C0592_10045 [Marinilabiliales bacterium]